MAEVIGSKMRLVAILGKTKFRNSQYTSVIDEDIDLFVLLAAHTMTITNAGQNSRW